MKKTEFTNRPRHKGNNSSRRNSNRFSKAPNSRPNSSPSQKRDVHPWVTSANGALTLTSHLPIINNKKRQDGANKKFSGKAGQGNVNGNGNGKYPSKFKGRNKASNGKFRNSGAGGPSQPRESLQGNPNRRPAAERTSRPVNQAPAVESNVNRDELVAGIDPFELFCAYHLGIGPKKEYKASNINEVAKRFGQTPATIKQALKNYGMDPGALLDRDFDLALAQLDIQVAPEGIDRFELAIPIYTEFLQAPVKKRDWNKILEEDRKENSKVFGSR